ncbi:MAG: hypothetical protein DRP29_08680 [Thermodesulfobacteriota bacterium]|nr:MAG: hypothetical protein DRP29_08680 [Thermodesulfobacteriota bacterium]
MEKRYLYRILLLYFRKDFYLHKLSQKALWIFCSNTKEITNKLKEFIRNDKTLKEHKVIKIRENMPEGYDFLVYCRKTP